MRLRPPGRLVLLLPVAIAACLPGGQLPRTPGHDAEAGASRGEGLALLEKAKAGAVLEGPFRAVFVGPEGDEVEQPQPQIVFSRPVRALGAKPGEPRLDVTFSPPIEGRWEWVGSSAARFVPKESFVPSTAYRFVLAPGLTALDGSALAGPAVAASFATGRPQISLTAGASGDRVGLRDAIDLVLSQAVDRVALASRLSVVDHAGRAVPFRLEPEDKDDATRVRLTPTTAWPEEEEIRVRVAAGVPGKQGNRPMNATELAFETALPLHVESIECSTIADGRCVRGADLTFSLSGPMRPSDLLPLVHVSPRAKVKLSSFRDDTPSSYLYLSLEAETNVAYTVEVSPSRSKPRQDPKKLVEELRPLRVGKRETFTFAPDETGVRLSFSGTYLLPGSGPENDEIAARADDVASAKAGIMPLDRALVMRLAADASDVSFWNLPGAMTKALPLRPSLQDPPAWTSLAAEMPKAPGPVLFGAHWTTVIAGKTHEGDLDRVLQRSELALYARVSSEGTLAWITSLRTGAPIEGVSVEARDAVGRTVQATSDRDGVALLDTSGFLEPAPTSSPGAEAATDGPAAATVKGRRAGSSWMVLFAQKGDDWIYQREHLPAKPRLKGGVFNDRGLYRPGEAVSLKGVVRRPTVAGLVPVMDKDIDLEIRDPEGRTSHASARLGPFGTWTHTLEQNPGRPLGTFSVSANVDGEAVGRSSFRVLEYRPATFSLRASLDRRSYVRGDALTCTGAGSYLYGGSLEGTKVEASFRHDATSFVVPGLVGYVTQTLRERFRVFHGRNVTRTLDATGQTQVPYDLARPPEQPVATELVTCELLATDAGLDSVFASSSAIVHPGDLYPAIEDLREKWIAPGQAIRPKLLAVSPDGTRHQATVKLELVVQERERSSKQVAKGKAGTQTFTTPPPRTVATCSATVGREPGGCALLAPPGPYENVRDFQLRATVSDDKGRVVTTFETLYPGQRPKPVPPTKPKKPTKPEPRAELVPDKKMYEPGETARLQAKSPFETGHVLLTIEREGIREHRVAAVGREPVVFEAKIDEATAPELWAEATFVAPFADTTDRDHTMATTTRLVSPIAHHALAVQIAPDRTEASPGEEMDVALDVVRTNGQPAAGAEITLYAADEATLSLANYQLPDFLDDFFARREHNVASAHTRFSLASLFDWKEELRTWGLGRLGHGSGTGTGSGFGSGHGRLGGSHTAKRPNGPRRSFQQTAFFYPSIMTDEHGHAKQHVKLPDGVTSYRIMAFALTKAGDVGTAQTNVVTNMPAQIRPVLPRVIRLGDRFVVAGMASNNGGAALSCTATLALQPVAALPAVAPLTPRGPLTLPVTLAKGESKRLVFDVAATTIGQGTVNLSLACGDLSDAAELPFEVTVPQMLETAAIHGETKNRVVEALGSLDAMDPAVGGLELTLSASPLAGLGSGLEQLVAYPYGCTEQTTSRLVPLLSLRELARALDVKLPDDLEAATRKAVQTIEQNQQKDGGFGLWGTSTDSSPWLSVYATWGLEEARRRHVPADDRVLDRARAHVHDLLARSGDGLAAQATAPFALDVLAEVSKTGGADAGGLGIIAFQLFDRRAELPIFARAQLLHAMGTLALDPVKIAALTKDLVSGVHLDGPVARFVAADGADAMLFDSGVRTSALVLRALLAVAPEHPLVTPLALGLVTDRRGGTWRTTQEAAFALLALDDYRLRFGAGEGLTAGDVSLGGASLLHHDFASTPGLIAKEGHASLSLAALVERARVVGSGRQGTGLSFTATGTTPLHYQALLRYAPRELPRDEVMAGFEIHRRYFPLPRAGKGSAVSGDEWKVDATSFREGDLVLAELEVVAPSLRRFVAIDDPIPGGFEAVDLDLQGAPAWIRPYVRGGATRTEHRDDRSVFFADALVPGGHRFAHLLRATAAGTFVTPPARVEEMYAPETYGRTAGTQITIR